MTLLITDRAAAALGGAGGCGAMRRRVRPLVKQVTARAHRRP